MILNKVYNLGRLSKLFLIERKLVTVSQLRITFVIVFCCASVVLNYDDGFGFQKPEPAGQAELLTEASFPTWRDRIRATESELVWQNLPWATSYHEGLRRAAAEDKPLLLWVMNGHPMGCT